MTKIEEVARAIAKSDGVYDWDGLRDYEQREFMQNACAAIEAMRMPSEAMVSAGWAAGDKWIRAGHPPEDSHEQLPYAFNAMIDAALSEPSKIDGGG